MDNQHREIKGYRELNADEIALMNEVKGLGERLGEMIEKLRSDALSDKRWVAESNTDLQKGIMCAVRAIARPTTF